MQNIELIELIEKKLKNAQNECVYQYEYAKSLKQIKCETIAERENIDIKIDIAENTIQRLRGEIEAYYDIVIILKNGADIV